MNNLLFVQATTTNQTGAKGLDKTAVLTATSEMLVKTMIHIIESDTIKYVPLVKASQLSHDDADKLIAITGILDAVDYSIVADIKSEDVDKMIRSQQSKRSRTKAKAMTQANYEAMMTGAVAENILRIAYSKSKSAVGGGSTTKAVDYTDEQLQTFKEKPEELAKAIRNIQSKKSIFKSKTGFDEQSERWQQLLAAEIQLKTIRDGLTPATAVVNKKAESADEALKLLQTVDIDKLKAADGKAILAQIQAMLSIQADSEAAMTAVDDEDAAPNEDKIADEA